MSELREAVAERHPAPARTREPRYYQHLLQGIDIEEIIPRSTRVARP
jgi:hypothetical protein